MDLAEDENFAYKHPYFFANQTFNFEGLRPEIKEKFENVVKIMGATVSKQSKHVLTDFLQKLLSTKKDYRYYSLSYLTDSMQAEKPLEIENYKLIDLVESANQSDYCCLNAKLILKHISCRSYFNQYCCCKLCIGNRRLYGQELLSKSNNCYINQVNGASNNANVHDSNEELNLHIETSNEGVSDLQRDRLLENPNDLPLEQQAVHSSELNEYRDSDHGDSDVDGQNDGSNQLLANGISHDNGNQENNSDSDDIEVIEILPNTHNKEPSFSSQSSRKLKTNINHEEPSCSIKTSKKLKKKNDDQEPSCSKQGCKKLITNQSTSIDRWKRARKVSIDSDDSDNSSETSPTRKRRRKHPRLCSSSPETINDHSSSDPDYIPGSKKLSTVASPKSSTEEENCIERKEWWLHLPAPQNADPNYKEPETSSKGRKRGRDYSEQEKQLMIAYLIVNNEIGNGTGRKPWMEMHKNGYMQDRSTESLNNHYRRILLPSIERFKLPKDIEKKFVSDRKRHNIHRLQSSRHFH